MICVWSVGTEKVEFLCTTEKLSDDNDVLPVLVLFSCLYYVVQEMSVCRCCRISPMSMKPVVCPPVFLPGVVDYIN